MKASIFGICLPVMSSRNEDLGTHILSDRTGKIFGHLGNCSQMLADSIVKSINGECRGASHSVSPKINATIYDSPTVHVKAKLAIAAIASLLLTGCSATGDQCFVFYTLASSDAATLFIGISIGRWIVKRLRGRGNAV